MRTLFVLIAMATLAPAAPGKVWTHLYRYDGVTPVAPVDANHPAVYSDIMVGTRLVLVISADTVVPWSGMLRLSWDDANEVTLSAREYNPKSLNYEGSCLAAAGKRALVSDAADSAAFGYSYSNDFLTAVPGDWFVFDYDATQVGSVVIEVYDLATNFDVPLETLSFTHVPSRDFNGDHIVNFGDFASLAGLWHAPVAAEAGRGDAAFDLNADGRIDSGDLARFTERWLERTDWSEPDADPNNPSAVP